MSTVHERTRRFLNPVGRRRREIVTPEGVALPVELAELGERATAFLLDVTFCSLASALLFLLAFLFWRDGSEGLVVPSVVLLVAFLVRNLYFIHFELAWQGVTPGKRIIGLRVIDRKGGPLLPAPVIARNLTRELECFMPLAVLTSLGGTGPGLWERLSLGLWLLLIGLLPVFNRDHLRGGDFIAGTMVVATPRRRLLGDLVETAAPVEFTPAQLRAYGAFELQILEELLRRPESAETARLRRDVCDRICRKIDWGGSVPDAAVAGFLRRFYTAQRAVLERDQLYGRAREDKNTPAAGT